MATYPCLKKNTPETVFLEHVPGPWSAQLNPTRTRANARRINELRPA